MMIRMKNVKGAMIGKGRKLPRKAQPNKDPTVSVKKNFSQVIFLKV